MSTTRDTFNKIAPGWYNYRHHTIFRQELETLARCWQSGRLLNVGCAHGPDFPPFRDGFELHGIDFSREMLHLARKYAGKYDLDVNLVGGDARSLPYTSNSFDYAIAVATYHHLENSHERVTALRELYRVLKPGGEAFITVWNRWQPRFWFKPKDVMVPWRSKEKTLYRYYHLFSFRELEDTARQGRFEVLRVFAESGYRFPLKMFSRNICLLVRKN